MIKVVHTLAWFSIESCMLCVLYAGFARRSDRRAGIAAGVVAGESLVYTADGFRGPLTGVAEHLGAQRGSVTDLYLPSGWPATCRRSTRPSSSSPRSCMAGTFASEVRESRLGARKCQSRQRPASSPGKCEAKDRGGHLRALG